MGSTFKYKICHPPYRPTRSSVPRYQTHTLPTNVWHFCYPPGRLFSAHPQPKAYQTRPRPSRKAYNIHLCHSRPPDKTFPEPSACPLPGGSWFPGSKRFTRCLKGFPNFYLSGVHNRRPCESKFDI